MRRCLLAELELEGKGATHGEARAAVRMSRRWAQGVAEKLSPAIREQVASELLEWRLHDVERTYLGGIRRAMLEEIGMEAATPDGAAAPSTSSGSRRGPSSTRGRSSLRR
jgi:hypothetical protein